MIDAVERIQDAGVAVNGCFIVGADGETAPLARPPGPVHPRCPLADVQLTLQTPFPGTALYRRLRSKGACCPIAAGPHYTLFDVTYQPDCNERGELETGFRDLVAPSSRGRPPSGAAPFAAAS